MIDFQAAVQGSGDRLKITLIGADHQVAAAHGALDHARADDVADRSPAGQRANGASLPIVECLHVTSGQQPRKEGLPTRSAR